MYFNAKPSTKVTNHSISVKMYIDLVQNLFLGLQKLIQILDKTTHLDGRLGV